jgi:hypothetical protein
MGLFTIPSSSVVVTDELDSPVLTAPSRFPRHSLALLGPLASLCPGVLSVLANTPSAKRCSRRDGWWHSAKENDDAPVS